jgi:hypothetical protein
VTETNATEAKAEQDSPRIEPWFKVLLAAFAPMAGAFILLRPARVPMFVATGVLIVTGFVMLVTHERKKL